MEFSEAEKYLTDHDKVLAKVIAANGHIETRPATGYFEALVRSIISQQISVKAAASIRERLVAATSFVPERILNLDEVEVKAIGLSGQKTKYLKDLAQHFIENPAVFDHLERLSDEEVITELTKVKGIGAWTAQMFLMFTLARPDVFAPGDRGLQLAMLRLYDLPPTTTPAELELLAAKWQPYRTTASLHLWKSLDNTP
jgi:DNA-3-methyladenine glycosylase II